MQQAESEQTSSWHQHSTREVLEYLDAETEGLTDTALINYLIGSTMILTVMFVNVIIVFLYEAKVERAMGPLRIILAPPANLLRVIAFGVVILFPLETEKAVFKYWGNSL